MWRKLRWATGCDADGRERDTLKQPVFGVFERGGRVFTEIVPDTNKLTLQRLIRDRIVLEAVIVTDGWHAYDGLVHVCYDRHLRIKKAQPKTFSQNGVQISGIESFWSYTKRRLARFNGVSKTSTSTSRNASGAGPNPSTLASQNSKYCWSRAFGITETGLMWWKPAMDLPIKVFAIDMRNARGSVAKYPNGRHHYLGLVNL